MIEWNPAAEQITGLARDTVMGHPAWEIKFNMLPPERRTPELYARLEANAQAHLQSGQALQANRLVEVELQRPDGSYRDVEVVDFAIETGAGFGWGSILRDVTERKQAQRIEAAQLAVSSILAESPETAVALKQILEAMAGQLEWQSAHLWRLDHTGSRLIWQDGWCAPGIPELAAFEQASQSYTFERGEGLSGAVWQTGQAIWDQDLHLVKGAADARVAGLHSATAIPIVMDSAPVGIMTFFSRSARPLDERLLAVLTDLGRQSASLWPAKEAEAAL
ncbi:MAG: PAS domain S-box protein, partial [Anaerolineales bacterium]|nr:PAS domain S-box protein [Anaerolineales bacterium]